MRNYDIFVAKTLNYNIFVAKIYDYALIDSFWGYPRFIDSPTSYATLLGCDSAMYGLQQCFTKQTLDFWHSHLNYAICNCCKTALLENNSRMCGSNIYAQIQLEPILCIFCNFQIEGLLKWFSADIILKELYQKLRAKVNRPEIAFLWLLQRMKPICLQFYFQYRRCNHTVFTTIWYCNQVQFVRAGAKWKNGNKSVFFLWSESVLRASCPRKR